MFFQASTLLPLFALLFPASVLAGDSSPGVIFITAPTTDGLSIENLNKRVESLRFETTDEGPGIFVLTTINRNEGAPAGTTWTAGKGEFTYHKKDGSEVKCHLEGSFPQNPPTVQWDFAAPDYDAQGDCPYEKYGIKLICGSQERCKTN